MEFKTDIQIAQETEMRNIQEIAASAGLDLSLIHIFKSAELNAGRRRMKKWNS